MNFKKNKYSVWYYSIINNAKLLERSGYIEKHHIIPKSIGGNNKKENIVKLTAREHFLCHWLLTKMLDGNDKQKMSYALWMMMHMTNKHQAERYKINSHTYQLLKENLAIVFSDLNKGRKLTEEHKRKISETRKRKIAAGEIVVNENKEKYKIISEKRKGYKHTNETKRKIGKKHKGKTISMEQREYLSKLNTGNVVTEETKKKISKRQKEQYASGERVAWNKGKKWKKGKKQTIEQRAAASKINKGRTWRVVNGKREWFDVI